jgi:hypothetical protein
MRFAHKLGVGLSATSPACASRFAGGFASIPLAQARFARLQAWRKKLIINYLYYYVIT